MVPTFQMLACHGEPTKERAAPPVTDRSRVPIGQKTTTEIQNRDITRDLREDEDWFLRLPPDVQDEIREKWRDDRMRFEPWANRQRQFRNRCLREGVFVCALPGALVLSVWPFLLAFPLGLATGYAWFHGGTGRLTSGMIAMFAVLCEYTVGGFWAATGDILGFVFSMLGIFLAGMLSSALGLRRELDLREAV